MNPTQQFLGEEATWPAVRIRFCNLHPLWGGRMIWVRGGGPITVQIVAPGQFERRYTFSLSAEEIQALLNLFITQDFVSIAIPARAGILPNETHAEITLVNSARQRHTVARWAHDPANAPLAAILTALFALGQRAQALEPSYQGPYQPLAEETP